jgi:hypothetical protein
MRSVLVVVVNEGPDHAPNLPLIDRDHMVQALPSQTAYPSLGEAILPRRAKRRTHLLRPKPIDSVSEIGPVRLQKRESKTQKARSAGRSLGRELRCIKHKS